MSRCLTVTEPARTRSAEVVHDDSVQAVVTVEKVVPGGRGFVRLADGRPALIEGGLPGDRVRLRVVRDHKAWVHARVDQLIEGSPQRVSPPCPVVERCGGCDWMALDPEAQLEAKGQLVREALDRTGHFRSLPNELRVHREGDAFGYRARIRLQIERGRVGFYSAGSHDLVEVEDCLVSDELVRASLYRLRKVVRRQPQAFAPFSWVEVRAAEGATTASLFFALRDNLLGDESRRALDELRQDFLVAVQGHPSERLERFPLGEDVYLLAAPGSFTQVNWPVNRALIRNIVDGALERGARTFADLYCGVGNFSLPLLRAGLSGVGVEFDVRAIGAASEAASQQGLDGGRFKVGDVSKVARRWAARGAAYDLIVVDPPRAGAKGALDGVVRLAKKAVVVVSCDPVTFARDLRGLVDRGLTLEQVAAYDMFPQTHHVECLAWLRV